MASSLRFGSLCIRKISFAHGERQSGLRPNIIFSALRKAPRVFLPTSPNYPISADTSHRHSNAANPTAGWNLNPCFCSPAKDGVGGIHCCWYPSLWNAKNWDFKQLPGCVMMVRQFIQSDTCPFTCWLISSLAIVVISIRRHSYPIDGAFINSPIWYCTCFYICYKRLHPTSTPPNLHEVQGSSPFVDCWSKHVHNKGR